MSDNIKFGRYYNYRGEDFAVSDKSRGDGLLTIYETLSYYLYGVSSVPENPADYIREVNSRPVRVHIDAQKFADEYGELMLMTLFGASKVISDFYEGVVDSVFKNEKFKRETFPDGKVVATANADVFLEAYNNFLKTNKVFNDFGFQFVHYKKYFDDLDRFDDWRKATFIYNSVSFGVHKDTQFVIELDQNKEVTKRYIKNLSLSMGVDNFDYVSKEEGDGWLDLLDAEKFKNKMNKKGGSWHDPYNIGRTFYIEYDNVAKLTNSQGEVVFDYLDYELYKDGFGQNYETNEIVRYWNYYKFFMALNDQEFYNTLIGEGGPLKYNIDDHPLVLGTALDDEIKYKLDFTKTRGVGGLPSIDSKNANMNPANLQNFQINPLKFGLYIYSGPGKDTITASDHNDVIVGGGDADTIDGRGGFDTVKPEHPDEDAVSMAVTVESSGLIFKTYSLLLSASGHEFHGDRLTSIELIELSDNADTLRMKSDGLENLSRVIFDAKEDDDTLVFEKPVHLLNMVAGDAREKGFPWLKRDWRGRCVQKEGDLARVRDRLAEMAKQDEKVEAERAEHLEANKAWNDKRTGVEFKNFEEVKLSDGDDLFYLYGPVAPDLENVHAGKGKDVLVAFVKRDDAWKLTLYGEQGNDCLVLEVLPEPKKSTGSGTTNPGNGSSTDGGTSNGTNNGTGSSAQTDSGTGGSVGGTVGGSGSDSGDNATNDAASDAQNGAGASGVTTGGSAASGSGTSSGSGTTSNTGTGSGGGTATSPRAGGQTKTGGGIELPDIHGALYGGAGQDTFWGRGGVSLYGDTVDGIDPKTGKGIKPGDAAHGDIFF